MKNVRYFKKSKRAQKRAYVGAVECFNGTMYFIYAPAKGLSDTKIYNSEEHAVAAIKSRGYEIECE